MTPEKWRQIDQLFHAALEREPEQRAAFLDQACNGDEALCREVESLLAADAETENATGSLLAQVAAEMLTTDRGRIATGQQIGHYHVLSPLGAGGMGEVYLAEDTRLGRKIALKLLPLRFTQDAERVHRFEREARAASALNHPNILTIHEIGEFDSTYFIATEFVEGRTLRQQMEGACMMTREALDVATQVASALNAAHSAGIIHRDIKPENIMLRPDGLVKVLDFGLAKLTESRVEDRGSRIAGSQFNPQSAIRNPQSTAPGMVMGTASYMSPEQARGLEVDARTDIFSLGVVIYEMVAGRAPFAGATPSDVMAAILTAEPEELSQHSPEAPPELERIVAKALRKSPEERYQVVKDLLVDLQDLKQELEMEAKLGHAVRGESVAAAHTTSSAEFLLGKIKQHKWGVTLALVTLIVVGAGIAYWLSQLIGQQKPAAPFQAVKLTRLTHTGKAMLAAISPDGKYVAHVVEEAGRQSLWLRHVATNSDTQIVPPAEANYRGLSFSPDGNFIYYVRGKPRDPIGGILDISGVLYKTTILGKDERKLIEKAYNSITLSPDGNHLAFVRPYPRERKSVLIVANADGTGERELATREDPNFFTPDGGLAWSPDSKIIACITANYTPALYRNVVGVRVADGVETPITSHKWYGVMREVEWLPDGSGLLVVGAERYGSSHQIWLLSYPDDKVQKVTDELNDYVDLSVMADSRTMAAVRSDRLVNIWIAPSGDVSRVKQITSGPSREDGVRGMAWTHDGKIVYRSSAGGGDNIWIVDAEGRGSKQLSFDDTANMDPAVSPDGRYIVWVASPKGIRNIWRMDIDGGNPKQLTNGRGEWYPQYSPDGKWLLYAAAPSRLWKLPVDGGAPVQLTSRPSFAPSLSPDGKQIAFNLLDEASGQWKIAVMPFEGGPPIKLFDILGSNYRPIVWTPDGRAVAWPVYRSVSNIWAQPLEGGPPKQLTDFRDGIILNFAWSRDGRQLALSRGLINSDVVLISNFK